MAEHRLHVGTAKGRWLYNCLDQHDCHICRLEDHVRWTAQTIHQNYHHEGGQDRKLWWEDCPKNTCHAARQVLGIKRTTGGDDSAEDKGVQVQT